MAALMISGFSQNCAYSAFRIYKAVTNKSTTASFAVHLSAGCTNKIENALLFPLRLLRQVQEVSVESTKDLTEFTIFNYFILCHRIFPRIN